MVFMKNVQQGAGFPILSGAEIDAKVLHLCCTPATLLKMLPLQFSLFQILRKSSYFYSGLKINPHI